jgi:hypothetical protein
MSVEPTALSGEVTEVAGSSEYSLDLYQTAAVCHTPEVSNVDSHRH